MPFPLCLCLCLSPSQHITSCFCHLLYYAFTLSQGTCNGELLMGLWMVPKLTFIAPPEEAPLRVNGLIECEVSKLGIKDPYPGKAKCCFCRPSAKATPPSLPPSQPDLAGWEQQLKDLEAGSYPLRESKSTSANAVPEPAAASPPSAPAPPEVAAWLARGNGKDVRVGGWAI